MRTLTARQVLGHRLRAHHLDHPLPAAGLLEAAGACGVQNSPPGACDTALWNRVEGLTPQLLQRELVETRRLLQAWSFRGAPCVFPTRDIPIFLHALIPQQGEPWIYTDGVPLVLEHIGMDFDAVLALVERAAPLLDGIEIHGKSALDDALARAVEPLLPPDKRALWGDPSMYGPNQTVGGAAVSFMLRPCALQGLVVFGGRQGGTPTFTSSRRWLGECPPPTGDGRRELVRRFLHCYGPADEPMLARWLGCSPRQAHRLWLCAGADMQEAVVEGKRRFILAEDADSFAGAAPQEDVRLLGPHDPYLDCRDRELLLPEKPLQRQVWKTVANPGAVLRAGRVEGIWKTKTAGGKLAIAATLWRDDPATALAVRQRAADYAAFRGLLLADCRVTSLRD